MNAVLKYPGAKNKIATQICSYIPEHKVYLEPYAGSLAVLFNKQRSHIETVNDLHDEVVNFFRVVRFGWLAKGQDKYVCRKRVKKDRSFVDEL